MTKKDKLLLFDTLLLPILGIISIFSICGGVIFNSGHFSTIKIPSKKFNKGFVVVDSIVTKSIVQRRGYHYFDVVYGKVDSHKKTCYFSLNDKYAILKDRMERKIIPIWYIEKPNDNKAYAIRPRNIEDKSFNKTYYLNQFLKNLASFGIFPLVLIIGFVIRFRIRKKMKNQEPTSV